MTLYLIVVAALACAIVALVLTLNAKAETGSALYRGKGAEAWHYRYVKEHRLLGRQGAKLRIVHRIASMRFRRDARYAIELASSVFGVSRSDMYAVANCESPGLAINLRNASTASGLFQFLDSTWRNQGVAGFEVWDPVANALGAARIVSREGWGQWSCKP